MKNLIFLASLILFTAATGALQFNSADVTNDQVFIEGSTVNITANVSDSNSSKISIFDPEGSMRLEEDNMTILSSENNSKIYNYEYTIPSNESGYWDAEITATKGNDSILSDIEFYVANQDPNFISQDNSPDFVRKGENVTIKANVSHSESDTDQVLLETEFDSKNLTMKEDSDRYSYYETEINTEGYPNTFNDYNVNATDSDGDSASVNNSFYVYESERGTGVNVKIAPSCSTSMDYFLVPGDGQIVQNKTGVFVEIVSNAGNVQSNISVDYLDVTKEGDTEWAPGEEIGEVIQSYPGDTYENINPGESETYFELFLAKYDMGNYTGRTSLTTNCEAEGPQNDTYQKTDLEEGYNCGNTSEDEFGCFNVTVYDENLVTSETVTGNITDETDVEVSEKREGTTGYEGNVTLNSTVWDVYTFNGTGSLEYDYGCITNNSLDEGQDCAYQGQTINSHDIEISDIEKTTDGTEATFSLLETNEDLLNTTLNCRNADNETANCDTFFKFFESFSLFSNFEIVDAIGDSSGGADEEGNQTTNSTVPENINQSGDQETNETVEGNNDNPGQTEVPEPEPEPEPTPEPDPQPRISIELDALNESVKTSQGEYIGVTLNVSNEGNEEINDLSIIPQPIYEDWDVQNASVTSIEPEDSLIREAFIRPGQFTSTGTYAVPISAISSDGRELDLDYVQVEVVDRNVTPKHELEEVPRTIRLEQGASRSFPVLVENTGDVGLENINARMQNIDECASLRKDSIENLAINDSKQINLEIVAGNDTEECDTTLVVSSDQGSYAFSKVNVTVLPESGLIPEQQRVPLIAILWTLVLMAYALATRKFDLDSLMVKGPYILLILGETLLIIYLLSTSYGVPGAELLPF